MKINRTKWLVRLVPIKGGAERWLGIDCRIVTKREAVHSPLDWARRVARTINDNSTRYKAFTVLHH